MIDERKNVQTTPTRTYCKHRRPLPYSFQISRTPRHWKFAQHHRSTRPPPEGWLVSYFGLNGPLRQYSSLYRAAPPESRRKKREMIAERKNVRTTPTSAAGPCPTNFRRSRTPLTEHHRTTRPPPWLVGCFGFNGPLRQYFSLYRAVSQREGERGQNDRLE